MMAIPLLFFSFRSVRADILSLEDATFTDKVRLPSLPLSKKKTKQKMDVIPA